MPGQARRLAWEPARRRLPRQGQDQQTRADVDERPGEDGAPDAERRQEEEARREDAQHGAD